VSDPDCIFCRIIAGELPSQRVDEDERTVAFMDVSPATRGHALVVPRRHARGQTVFHFHMHVIPRYHDDPLHLPWTPKSGDTDEIAAVADLLR
jgi:histidine triad (HIT) family protein